ncbi:TPA_asm: N [Bouteloa betacytorhabdovirus 1]|nr:TPA_asm: N [Bouteloa betacytorhabdovirus 1]
MTQAREINMDIAPEFANVSEASITTLVQPLTWTNSVLTDSQGYKLKDTLTSAEINSVLSALRASMDGEITGYECQMLTYCVAYIRRAGRVSNNIMNIDRNLGNEDIPWKPSLASNATKTSDYNTKTARKKEIEDLKADSSKWNAKSDAERTAMETELNNLKKAISDALLEDETNQPSYTIQTYSDEERAYNLFMMCFLTRMLSKSSDNIDLGWSQAHERYSNFYMGKKPSLAKKPSKTWVEAVKMQFGLDRKAAKSILKMIVLMEKAYPQADSPDAGLVRYLFSLPNSYAGMHAYKLFCNVKEQTKKKNAWLLSVLKCPMNNAALNCIMQILNNFELTSERSDTSFRYARLVGPQYFAPLQTKSCPALVYTLTQILNHYVNPDDRYNPENIVSLRGLGADIKANMKLAATMIVNASPIDDKSSYSGIMAKAFTTKVRMAPEKPKVTAADLLS